MIGKIWRAWIGKAVIDEFSRIEALGYGGYADWCILEGRYTRPGPGGGRRHTERRGRRLR
jgi:hypothetical protein